MRYTLYKVDNSKRSSIRGYWLDNGKLYRDNVILVKYRQKKQLDKGIKALFDNGEKAVFWKGFLKAYCIEKTGKVTVYHNRQLLRRSRLSVKEIKSLLAEFGGITIQNCKRSIGGFLIEIFSV